MSDKEQKETPLVIDDNENEPEIEPEIEVVLQKVAKDDPQSAQIIEHYIAVQQTMHQGPMPSPDSLKDYAITLPTLPDRMMKMAEEGQKSKINQNVEILKLKSREIDIQEKEVEQAAIAHKREVQVQTISLVCAFVTVLVCIIGAFYLALQGKTEVALVVGGTTVVGIVAAFLKKNVSQTKEKK